MFVKKLKINVSCVFLLYITDQIKSEMLSPNDLCDDLLIQMSTWCDLTTLTQLIKTQRRFSKLFHYDYVWKYRVRMDFGSNLTLETSHYLSYQLLFKKANFLNLIKPLGLSIAFKHVSTLLELDRGINRYWLEAVKQNGLLLQYVPNQTEAICLKAVKQN